MPTATVTKAQSCRVQTINNVGVCEDLDFESWTRGEDKPIDKINN